MWNKPTAEELAQLPRLYKTEGFAAIDKIIVMHFFFGSCDWYAVEFDGEDTFFGFAILNNDLHCAEWGYFSLAELEAINLNDFEVDRDLYWQPCPAGSIERIRGLI